MCPLSFICTPTHFFLETLLACVSSPVMVEHDLHPALNEPFDASDPEQVKKRDLAAKRREKQHRDAIVGLLSTSAGRSWVYSILESCQMFGTTFVRGEPDSSAYNEGRRSVAIQIWASLEAVSPEMLATMRREASGR